MSPGARVRVGIGLAVGLAYILLPLGTVVAAWMCAPEDWLELASLAAVAGWMFVAGNWSWAGYPARWLYVAGLVVAAGHAQGDAGAALAGGVVAAAAAATALAAWIAQARGAVLDAEAPFEHGLYYVAHGGPLGWLNHHARSAAQRHALDLVRLGAAGTRARGWYPGEPAGYAIWETAVVCPCAGTVTAVADDRPDFDPPQRDPRNPAGNFVMIETAPGIYIGLAHLRRGSARVQVGERVLAGQPLGRVGNSGNSSEPHLHLQAKRGGSPQSLLDGEGVPLRLGGRRLRRSSLLWVGRRGPLGRAAWAQVGGVYSGSNN